MTLSELESEFSAGGPSGGELEARAVSAWFGDHLVLEGASLRMPRGAVTALIGPSGCGKSTFLRTLNRMHELVPGASLGGEVLLDGEDLYGDGRLPADVRGAVGMVFQKPNPFPTMSIYDNVLSGLAMNGRTPAQDERDEIVWECLSRASLWDEVKNRLRDSGASLSGGQQQRLCIARSLAVRPKVLLMDEPCSALDPTSTRRIEESIIEMSAITTVVIVTHNMGQARRVSDFTAFFLAEAGKPGRIFESGATEDVFETPKHPKTHDYVTGRFG